MITRNFFVFRKYRYVNSLLNATYPVQIYKAVLEKLRFEKKVKKIFKSLKFMDQSFCPKNSTENYPKSTARRNFEAIKSIVLHASSS